MSYGKLETIKVIGQKPVFVILDERDEPIMVIPDFEDWMLSKIGHKVDLFITDKYFHATDCGEV